jgi:D-alanyl-D-alanine carboxypeptidase
MPFARRRLAALLLAALALAPPAAPGLAQAPAPAVSPPSGDRQVAREVDRIARRYAALERFSGSVLAARGGRVLFRGGYGLADRERGIANTPATRFDIGSLSKQFTAAAVLKLEAEGKLSVDSPVSRYLPDYPKEQGSRITLHHLLTHTSGLPSLGRRGPLESVAEDCTAKTLDELLAYSRDLPLQFAPGAEYRYSNSGYMLLAAVVERVSGVPFDEYLRTALFRPAGLRATGRAAPDAAVPGRAVGYMGYEPGVAPAACHHPGWQTGAGGVLSTVDDLYRWERALEEGRVLPPAQLAKLYHPHVSRGRANAFYGYGWMLGRMHDRPVVTHGGTIEGFVSEFYRFPDDGVLVIVLSNRLPVLGVDVPAEIGRRAAALLLGKAYELPPEPARLPADSLRRLAGRYELRPGWVVDVRVDGDRLVADAGGDASWSLATYAAQRGVDAESDTVARGMRLVRAFADGDVAALRGALLPGREGVEDESLRFLRSRIDTDPRFGRLIKLTPWRVVPDGEGAFVDARATFEHGEWFVRAELGPGLGLSGWYYGDVLPSRVALVPEAGGGFFVDGFRWEEPDLRVRFTAEGGGEMVIEDPSGPVVAQRLPDAAR